MLETTASMTTGFRLNFCAWFRQADFMFGGIGTYGRSLNFSTLQCLKDSPGPD